MLGRNQVLIGFLSLILINSNWQITPYTKRLQVISTLNLDLIFIPKMKEVHFEYNQDDGNFPRIKVFKSPISFSLLQNRLGLMFLNQFEPFVFFHESAKCHYLQLYILPFGVRASSSLY
jgi:hypothetical protein